ncbi:hypothetical protein BX285_4142 [Streptomyces sp. 1114.5]|uniref:response regulator transcription factor n=1 Tax=Streptomyces sp. 1114.5 TaxID=1938830 RepID=UPI000EB2E256|nr:response regulator transcription factor [Streptomyces sp. 1114.5]RKT19673.1 hypothetical protein BX285_4142 [Streptomyces sp. 1114.5]
MNGDSTKGTKGTKGTTSTENTNGTDATQGTLTAFDGRLVLDLDARTATVDGREAQLTRQDAKLLRGLIELGEGVHAPDTILLRVWGVLLNPVELRYPISVLRLKLGRPSWIERTEAGYALRPPEREQE